MLDITIEKIKPNTVWLEDTKKLPDGAILKNESLHSQPIYLIKGPRGLTIVAGHWVLGYTWLYEEYSKDRGWENHPLEITTDIITIKNN